MPGSMEDLSKTVAQNLSPVGQSGPFATVDSVLQQVLRMLGITQPPPNPNAPLPKFDPATGNIIYPDGRIEEVKK